MTDKSRFRRLAGALCLVLGPALLLAASIVVPWTGDAEPAEYLRITGENVTATQVGGLLALVAFLALIPATLAVMRVLGRRAPLLGLTGGALAVAGWACGMLWVVSDQIFIGLAERESVRDEAAAALDASSAWVIDVMFVLFLAGIVLGVILLGVGLWRARVVPRWAAAAVALGGLLGPVAHAADSKALDLVGTALLLVGLATVARLVWSLPDRDWERGEIAVVADEPSERAVTA